MSERYDPLADLEHLKSVIDTMADPVTVVLPDYRVVLVNEQARRLFSGAAPAGGAIRCYEASHRAAAPCSGGGHPCPMERARETGLPVTVLHEHFDERGRPRYVEITASPMRDGAGEFAGIVESQRDVTGRVRAERRLARYAAELGRANRMKDVFIDIMRHDLMTPLFGILALAGTALRRDPAPEDREDYLEIGRMARKISDLVQNASALAKLEEGEELAVEELDLAHMAETAAAELGPAAAERGMTIRVETRRPSLARVNPLLKDVFANLLGNGVKYAAAGTAVVVAVERGAGLWRIVVADRGPGIADADKEAVFTRYERREKGAVKGTGLGLAIVKRIVDGHCGAVRVEDNPGGGARFVVELPDRGD